MRTAASPNSKIAVRPVNPNVHISMTARKAERVHICELLRELIDTAKQTHTTPLETCSAIERLIAMLTSHSEPKERAQ
ncbi:hypothetical protein ACNDF6_001313 [Escherichia coli]